MMGTKRLDAALDSGVAAVKKADDSLRVVMVLAAASVIVSLISLAVLIATRGARA